MQSLKNLNALKRNLGHTIDLKQCVSKISQAELRQKVLEQIWQHGTICLKNQSLEAPEMKYLAQAIGQTFILPKNFTFENSNDQYPEVIKVGNVKADGSIVKGFQGAEYWHHDGNFFANPQNRVMNILHTKIRPNGGGQTGFLDMVAPLYNNVFTPIELEKLRRSTLEVSVKNIKDFVIKSEEDVIPSVIHPVVNIHPMSGFEYLYLPSNPQGLYDTKEQKHWISNKEIWDRLQEKGYIYQHNWEDGDVLLWDNCTTMHRSMGGYFDSARLLYRIQAKYAEMDQNQSQV